MTKDLLDEPTDQPDETDPISSEIVIRESNQHIY